MRAWMQFAGPKGFGRLATRLASWPAPPHRARNYLARLTPAGYLSPSATLAHGALRTGVHVFVADRVVLYQSNGGGPITLGDRVHLYSDSVLETGDGASITIGADSSVHPRCQLMAHKGSIDIGSGVAIAANCAFYAYDHGIEVDLPIRRQPLHTKGDIVIGNESWLGTGVIVLSGVRIGHGAVVGAGSVVTKDVPDGCVAVGVPAKVVKTRAQLSGSAASSPPS